METSTAQQNQTITPSMSTSELDDGMMEVSQYVVALVVTCWLVAIGIYLVVCLLFYEVQVGAQIREIRQLNKQRHNVTQQRVADWMSWLCLIASILALVRFGLELVEIVLGQSSSTICDPIRKCKAVLQWTVITCLHVVLWLRQRVFYKMPALFHLSNAVIRLISKTVVLIMAVANVFSMLLYVATRQYQNSGRGCQLSWTSIWTKLPCIVQFIFTTLFQVILLGLLVYPLYKHWMATKRVVSNSLNKEVELIKRVTIATLVTMVLDIAAGLLVLHTFDQAYEILYDLVYDIDLLINLLAVICTLADRRTRMAPFLVRQSKIVETTRRKYDNSQRSRVMSLSNDVWSPSRN
ncbi:uncharacterized protein LOC143460340 [Clavelina lepadiformis]|uniref:uncharacterized protein LOC143460340 n=1 Tax=Clavelina lepadiformis TaxID=159417 RepID=UPI0040433FB3